MNLASYTTPVSVDHFGHYPGAKPGDVIHVMFEGKVYVATVQAGPAHHMPNGTILRDFHFQQVEGPVTRDFMPRTYRMPRGRRWSTARGYH